MNKLLSGIVAACSLATLFFVPLVHAESGYINQADIDAIDKVFTATEAFNTEYAKEDSTLESVGEKGAAVSTVLGELIALSFNTSISDEYTKEAGTLKSAATDLKSVMDTLPTIVETKDEAKLSEFEAAYNEKLQAYDKQTANFNKAVDNKTASEGNGYLWLVLATAAVSAGGFVWAFFLQDKNVNEELKKAKKGVAFASIAPLAGAVVTYITFMFADQLGGTYFIAWGPVLIGGIVLVQSIVNYVKLAKISK